jgi:hypothetical protein
MSDIKYDTQYQKGNAMKTATSPNTGMSGAQFLTLKSAVINE